MYLINGGGSWEGEMKRENEDRRVQEELRGGDIYSPNYNSVTYAGITATIR